MKRVIISGGGTGGHIFPALAIADALKEQFPSVDILFIGAKNRMEMERVPKAGYPIEGLDIVGIQRSLTLRNLQVPVKLWKSYRRAQQIIAEKKPEVVIGVGGYASAPTLLAAIGAGVPTLIQEQNSYAGLTNRWLGKYAHKICVAYPGMEQFFPADKVVYTGNPVRKDILQLPTRAEALQALGLKANAPVLLVMGGSLGARVINESICAQIRRFADNGIQVIWQTGKHFIEKARQAVEEQQAGEWVHPTAFIERMDYVYSTAHVIISRAGALSISELCVVGKPAILVPSPYVAEDHQTKNAMALVQRQAAKMVSEAQAPAFLVSDALALLHSPAEQALLSENIRQMARPNATQHIVQCIKSLVSSTAS
ncbi:UDP-N-acetylglucosamine--N-acetylmuramyl-(pentapeptide) pyrophosphoryl-undecaprenol N-acetylglucosamine transferase [Thermonema lapsum]|uniref:UDP-N-acetylglucosamine--N-acetylmuramyl-(pentapeptide) pyrophosphoryl-undecaprenol N-acetylglucosamine transferase n=1 Tax=Thermonema lapsum TaxID=28195 RepID=A0A846MR47_9BACT|nr:undecaprenyldiphospho-muramoylpentapeptide beta-N-acetylglucosaminyltransferase [Thermonema lapsum]NIK73737.1 UDP-N-acetylglucosamine--N-acetylmuramyl-(pentapeptide) pyrophosphoryl-undecaprenol N-acetylglucosamine transferase [Thermonema lapsum]